MKNTSLSKIDEIELAKSISYSLWGIPPKVFVYSKDELNNEFSNYLIELHNEGYILIENNN